MHAALLAALWAAGADTEPFTAPTGPAPEVAYVKSSAGGLVKNVQVYVPIVVKKVIEVKVGDKTERREVAVTELRTETRAEMISLDKAAFGTAGGKKLTKAEATKRIGTGAIVVMSPNGVAVDKAFLKAFKPDTVVIITARRPFGGGPTAPIPPPILPRPADR